MRCRIVALCLLALCSLDPSQAESDRPAASLSLVERTRALMVAMNADALLGAGDAEQVLPGPNLRIRDCDDYPYSESARATPGRGPRLLVADMAQGLETGLACLSGTGPMGPLHRYHEHQAHRLLDLFENGKIKTLQCVEDAMFATAVATSPRGVSPTDPLYRQLRLVEHPAVIIDTFRLGGILSRRYDDETYRSFFHLADADILEHRNGQPLRPPDLHRYDDRPGLIFHEMVHWLGHEHSALYPDTTHLYETCCFGGSDYIRDPETNLRHQRTACAILKDDTIWGKAHNPYRQMRLWHLKGYDTLKTRMRADYDS
jgi:hypothetical protein